MSSPPTFFLETPRLVLKIPSAQDGASIARYYQDNLDHLKPWTPGYSLSVDVGYWADKAAQLREEFERGCSTRFYIWDKQDNKVAGNIALSNLTWGPLRAARLGYSIGLAFQGTGRMREAAQKLIGFAFSQLRLHRIEANFVVGNQRSEKLLGGLGFTREGIAKKYLFIAGRWRDHVLNSLTNPDEAATDYRWQGGASGFITGSYSFSPKRRVNKPLR